MSRLASAALLAAAGLLLSCTAMTLVPRTPAASFRAASSLGHAVGLDDYRGQYLVLYFFPRSFALACTWQTIAFRDAAAQLRALGAEILGVSGDDPEALRAFAEHYQTGFAIAADVGGGLSAAYAARHPRLGRIKRVTFVIDPEGQIVARFHHELRVREHVRRVLVCLQSRAR